MLVTNLEYLNSKFTLKGLSFCFPPAPSANQVGMKTSSGALPTIPEYMVLLATSGWPRLVITFLQPSQHNNQLMLQVSCQHWDPLCPLHAQTPSHQLQLPWTSGRLPACLVTAHQPQSGQTSKLLCHPVSCSHPFFNMAWAQILGPLFQEHPSLRTLPQLCSTAELSFISLA